MNWTIRRLMPSHPSPNAKQRLPCSLCWLSCVLIFEHGRISEEDLATNSWFTRYVPYFFTYPNKLLHLRFAGSTKHSFRSTESCTAVKLKRHEMLGLMLRKPLNRYSKLQFFWNFDTTTCYKQRLNYRIQGHLFTHHWITIVSIVICFVLQKPPTPVNEVHQGGPVRGIEWSL